MGFFYFMTTEEYLETLKEGNGHLNPNYNKRKESHSDYGGYLKIDGCNIRIEAWVVYNQNGDKILKLMGRNIDNLMEVDEL